MSATYKIDTKEMIVFSKYTGVVEPEIFIDLFGKIIRDSLFKAEMQSIADLTEAKLHFGIEGVKKIRNHFKQFVPFRSNFKWAAIVGDDNTYGVIRQYSALMTSIGIEVGIFKDSEQALKWIKD